MRQEQWEREGYWRDYYDVLQVSPRAEPETIRGARNALTKQYHPDTGTMRYDERMKLINEAAEIRLDPSKRARYDSAYQDRHRAREKTARTEEDTARRGASQSSFDTAAQQGTPTPTFWDNLLKVGVELLAERLKGGLNAQSGISPPHLRLST
jgi:DnaJ-class molecular chaperone